MTQRRIEDLMATMADLAQQQTTRIEALQQQMDLHVQAHTQQMTEMRAQTQQTTLIHQQQIAFQQAQQDHHRAQDLARGPRGPASIKRFHDLRPPTFAGIEQALEADEWLQRITDALKAADVEDGEEGGDCSSPAD